MKRLNPGWKITLFSFLLFFLNAFALVYYGKGLEHYSTKPKLDFQVGGYDLAFVRTLFQEYGQNGLKYYYFLTLIDIPFPFVVLFFGLMYAAYTWKKWGVTILWIVLSSAAVSFWVFDIIENFFLLRMMEHYPDLSAREIFWSSLCTRLKLDSLFVFYSGVILTFIFSLLRPFLWKNSEY